MVSGSVIRAEVTTAATWGCTCSSSTFSATGAGISRDGTMAGLAMVSTNEVRLGESGEIMTCVK